MNKNKLALLMLLASFKIHAAPVDLELSLVIDVSGSVDSGEYNLMMDGYAAAFRNTALQSNILGGTNGSISVNTIFFSSSAFTTPLDNFTLLDSVASINAYADLLDTFARPGSGGTNIYTGTNKAIDLLDADTLFESTRQIIDISGDGTDTASLNQGSRADAEAKGYTINGITIGSTSVNTFYLNNVITSNGLAFHADDFVQFEAHILEKLKTETNTNPNPVPEPATLSLLLLGILGFRFSRKSVH